jgi:broad specificity polyphosphatase/5'/3'-nucleotidase SurE
MTNRIKKVAKRNKKKKVWQKLKNVINNNIPKAEKKKIPTITLRQALALSNQPLQEKIAKRKREAYLKKRRTELSTKDVAESKEE